MNPYHVDTDPNLGCEKKFVTDPDPGKNDKDTDPGKKELSMRKIFTM